LKQAKGKIAAALAGAASRIESKEDRIQEECIDG
jgi:hypothetical protein